MIEKQERWKSYYYIGVSIGVHGVLCLLVALSVWLTASKATSHTTMEVELTDVSTISQRPQEEKGGGGGGGTPNTQSVTSDKRPSFTSASQGNQLFNSQTVGTTTETKASTVAASNTDEANTYGISGQAGATRSSGSGIQSGTGTGTGSGTGSGTGTSQGTGSGSGSGSSTGSGTGGGTTIDWRSRFVARVEQNKTYPFQARKQGVTGMVRVRVVISQGGSILENQVVSSSGDSRLDQAALEAVRASVPYSHENGGSLSMTIPIRFRLN